nr:regulator of sigma protease [Candidatus Cloacimonadota bacterium]
MISLLLMILALGLMITIHETGHFLVARAFGVGIRKFSIGFGAPIIEWERRNIKYRISWIPLGGYVKMKGEEEDEEAPDVTNPDELFSNKAWWKRALIGFSGPFANLLFGFFLFIVAFIIPQQMDDLAPVIFSAEGIWAEHFEPGDSLVAVNGKEVFGFNEFLMAVNQSEEAEISYKRNGELLSLNIDNSLRDSLIVSLRPQVSTRIGEVFAGMPAWRAGLKPGDIVLEVDSVAVTDWYDMRDRIMNNPRGVVNLTLQRGDEIFNRQIVLEENIAADQGKMIGISQYFPISKTVRYNPIEAVQLGTYSTGNFIVMNYRGLYQLAKRPWQLKNNLGGPVLMASMSTEIGRRGFGSLLFFFASISLILMIMNLLPIPILDGGLIMFCVVEGIIGRPIPQKIQGFLQQLGFIILISLMIFAFYSDISKLVYRIIYTR